ncbi:putative hexaprenyl pyrophosphate synthase, mitochondrial [Erysiphe neolycopersici]|uniref:Putative hexaprenyl pyrophosphate synthase, mitochondrial n=1 Tax=Erysiphe neolycopersici TaxID=212602 RepID=A0A420HP73_9PEZI|nr:putative hexaprenyl pyrophosphate synthase, mitochondrial [Erysiphe neolycopersici]
MKIQTTRASWLFNNYIFPGRPVYTVVCYYHPNRKSLSSLSQAASITSNIFSKITSRTDNHDVISSDPLRMLAKEMKSLTGNIKQLIGSGHPSLDTVAKYYTQTEGKHIRPYIVLLMSRATAIAPKVTGSEEHQESIDVNDSLSPLSILSDVNPESSINSAYNSRNSHPKIDVDILPSQRRLAEITELIHTASLLHDDVVDYSTSRRGNPSANLEFGNKMAVLAGDFLLGRASVALARLRDAEVTELLATVIANLVEGEFMQLKNTAREEKNPIWTEDTITYYLKKTYLKTASLISKSCRATALLGRVTPEIVDAAYYYGKNLGLAFQLIDDMLDYTTSEKELGKPAGADLELGLATAPLLFAWQHYEELGMLVGRKFANKGDVSRARHLVINSDGLNQTRALAESYAQKAIDSIRVFPQSDAKKGLEEMATKIVNRKK